MRNTLGTLPITALAIVICAALPSLGQVRVQSAGDHPKFQHELPDPPKIDGRAPGARINLEMRESEQFIGLHDSNDQPIRTRVWGYNQQGKPAMYLGPTILAKSHVPLDVRVDNQLPDDHLFETLVQHSHHAPHPADGRVPTVVHLHGGHTEAESDGYPTAWYTRDYNTVGAEFKKKVYHFANSQEAANLWYHDHTMGITRLNVGAGLAAMYLITDDHEQSLPLPRGQYDRELILHDLQIDEHGQLSRGSEFPSYFGNYQFVNGMAWPVLDVEPRKYRFRILNASDSRFYLLKLSSGQRLIQIGTDGGLIERPQELDQLEIAPGERYDLVIDFQHQAGKEILLHNNTWIVPGLPNLDGNMRDVMKFRVGTTVTTPDQPLPDKLREPIQYLGEPDRVRRVLLGQALDLSNGFNINKPIIDLLGTVEEGLMRWADPVTEVAKAGDVEVWEIYNGLLVPHPIHVHQSEFQILSRQPHIPFLSSLLYFGKPTGRVHPIPIWFARGPERHERGWKDEVIVPPLTMARIKVRFDRTGKYVWHCHLLTHEDHDMMRPLEVTP